MVDPWILRKVEYVSKGLKSQASRRASTHSHFNGEPSSGRPFGCLEHGQADLRAAPSSVSIGLFFFSDSKVLGRVKVDGCLSKYRDLRNPGRKRQDMASSCELAVQPKIRKR